MINFRPKQDLAPRGFEEFTSQTRIRHEGFGTGLQSRHSLIVQARELLSAPRGWFRECDSIHPNDELDT